MRFDIGDKVHYAGATQSQIDWHGTDDPRDLLTVGKTYTVHRMDVQRWHTTVQLLEVPGKQFNSVSFVEVE